MPATFFLLLVATISSVDGDIARIDHGRLAGLRPGDVGTVYYELKVGAGARRIDVGSGTLIETGEHYALLRFAEDLPLRPEHRVEFRIPIPLEAGQDLVQRVRGPVDEVESSTTGTNLPKAEESLSPIDASVRDFVLDWARSWSEQRVDDYLAHYASNFRPPNGLGRGDWEAQRRQRISSPASIEVGVEQLEIVTVASRAAVATFVQSYRSATYKDRVAKLLDLVREGGEWRILEERLLE
ncbi:MAG: hypothetical protein AAF657_10945 [Acidobacteriota bacterium]